AEVHSQHDGETAIRKISNISVGDDPIQVESTTDSHPKLMRQAICMSNPQHPNYHVYYRTTHGLIKVTHHQRLRRHPP
ncbi:MAG: hypothetical protein ACKPKO_45605, partial [Candidatus Fonsibacter sp.]